MSDRSVERVERFFHEIDQEVTRLRVAQRERVDQLRAQPPAEWTGNRLEHLYDVAYAQGQAEALNAVLIVLAETITRHRVEDTSAWLRERRAQPRSADPRSHRE